MSGTWGGEMNSFGKREPVEFFELFAVVTRVLRSDRGIRDGRARVAHAIQYPGGLRGVGGGIEGGAGIQYDIKLVGERGPRKHFLKFGQSESERYPAITVGNRPAQRPPCLAANPDRHPVL